MFDHLESTYFLITFTFKGIHKRCLFFFKYLLLTSNGYYRKVQQIYNTYLLNRKNMHLSFKVYITFNYLEITYELLGSIKDFDVGFTSLFKVLQRFYYWWSFFVNWHNEDIFLHQVRWKKLLYPKVEQMHAFVTAHLCVSTALLQDILLIAYYYGNTDWMSSSVSPSTMYLIF